MRATIDRLGRLVIPKAIRTSLGIHPDTELELMIEGSGLHIEPVAPVQRSITEIDGLPLLGLVEGASINNDDIRNLRDQLNR